MDTTDVAAVFKFLVLLGYLDIYAYTMAERGGVLTRRAHMGVSHKTMRTMAICERSFANLERY